VTLAARRGSMRIPTRGTNSRLTTIGVGVAVAAFLGILAGCNGSGSSNSAVAAAPPPTAAPPTAAPITAVPASASANDSSYVGFLLQLSMDDAADPLTTDGVVPPTSENTEPLPVV